MGNIELLEDATAALPHTTRKMFGGHGLFAPNGGMFAGIVSDDAIMLKFADDKERAAFEAVGGRAWVYKGKGNEMTMREWIVIPDALYDDPRGLAKWAARAYDVVPAKRASSKKRSSGKGTKSAKRPAGKKATKRPAPRGKKAPAKKPRGQGS